MQNKNRVNKIAIQKIIDYCDKIEELKDVFGNTFENFNSNLAFQLSCSMCIVQIGELTNRFSDEFKNQYSKIPWHAIKAMRNIFVHEYEKTDFDRVWKNLTEDTPELKEILIQILSEMDSQDEN